MLRTFDPLVEQETAVDRITDSRQIEQKRGLVVRPLGANSNEELFETLENWNNYLKADQRVSSHLRPPCP